jgi:hypothetical protein
MTNEKKVTQIEAKQIAAWLLAEKGFTVSDPIVKFTRLTIAEVMDVVKKEFGITVSEKDIAVKAARREA